MWREVAWDPRRPGSPDPSRPEALTPRPRRPEDPAVQLLSEAAHLPAVHRPRPAGRPGPGDRMVGDLRAGRLLGPCCHYRGRGRSVPRALGGSFLPQSDLCPRTWCPGSSGAARLLLRGAGETLRASSHRGGPSGRCGGPTGQGLSPMQSLEALRAGPAPAPTPPPSRAPDAPELAARCCAIRAFPVLSAFPLSLFLEDSLSLPVTSAAECCFCCGVSNPWHRVPGVRSRWGRALPSRVLGAQPPTLSSLASPPRSAPAPPELPPSAAPKRLAALGAAPRGWALPRRGPGPRCHLGEPITSPAGPQSRFFLPLSLRVKAGLETCPAPPGQALAPSPEDEPFIFAPVGRAGPTAVV